MEPPSRTPAQVYEEFAVPGLLAPCAAALFEVVPPIPGDRVLDVACGTGVVARAAWQIVGPSGNVSAIDLRHGMIEVAASLDQGPHIDWAVGDALALDFDDGAFDVVFCQQGLQFFADRHVAVREMARVLTAGGRLGVAVWQGVHSSPFFVALTDIEAGHLNPLGLTYEDLTGPFRFGDPTRLRELVTDAGFSQVQVEERLIEARFPTIDFVENIEFGYSAVIPEFSESPAAFRAFVEAVDREMDDILEAHRVGDEIVFTIGANIATGTIPAGTGTG